MKSRHSLIFASILMLLPVLSSAYPTVRRTARTKTITVQELPLITDGNLGQVGDSLFFLDDKIYNMDAQVISSGLKLYHKIRGNPQPVFVDGRATYDNGQELGVVDRSGKIIWKKSKRYGESISRKFVTGYAVRYIERNGNKYGEFIDRNAKTIYPQLSSKPYGQSDCHPFSDGLALYESGRKKGYINRSGAIVIPCKWASAHSFSEGLAAVEDPESGKWGFIDTKGRVVIDFKFSREPEDFIGGVAVVEKNDGSSLGWGERAFISRTGEVLSDGWDKKIVRVGKIAIAIGKQDQEYHVFGLNGKTVDLNGIFDWDKSYPKVIPSTGNLLCQNNLRSKEDLSVMFVSKASFPVDGRDDVWFDLVDAGDGFLFLVKEWTIYGIVNEKGEVVIEFKKSEF